MTLADGRWPLIDFNACCDLKPANGHRPSAIGYFEESILLS